MTSFCEEKNTSPDSTQRNSDKGAISWQPTCCTSWGVALNKSLKGTLQYLLRKKAASLLLKSAVNDWVKNVQWLLLVDEFLKNPNGHLFVVEQEVLYLSKGLTLTLDWVFNIYHFIINLICIMQISFFFPSIVIMLSTCLGVLSGTVGVGLACHMPNKTKWKDGVW